MSTAVAFYCGTFVFGSAAFNLLVAAIRAVHCVARRSMHTHRQHPPGFRITFMIYFATTLLRWSCRGGARAQCRGAGAPAPHPVSAGTVGGGRLNTRLEQGMTQEQ